MMEIILDQGPLELVPGQEISGTARWNMPNAPRDANLRLFWYTEGRGTTDVGLVDELPIQRMMPLHEERFRFTLPMGPYSFQGKLITLRWALELLLDKGKQSTRLDLMVSPWVEQVSLGTVGETPIATTPDAGSEMP